MLYPIILCGGDGTRLWPASRKALPKQFMPLHNTTTFIETVRRALALPYAGRPFIVCNQAHRFLAATQLREALETIPPHLASKFTDATGSVLNGSVLLEPVGKNTAPAIAFAALHLQALHKAGQLGEAEPLLLVLPADHLIKDSTVFAEAVNISLPLARKGKLVTFGIVPTAPETGYGYIKKGELLENTVCKVERFVEKPDVVRAEAFVKSGEYFWNSGMFLFAASAFLQELQTFAPKMHEACTKAYTTSASDLDFVRAGPEAFSTCSAESIDYAVMEHTKRACVTPLATLWNDLGSWDSLYETAERDPMGNATEGDVLLHDCENSLVFAQSRLVTGLGLLDMVVVETADAVMVAPKTHAQHVKQIVNILKEKKRSEAEEHARVYRPWGSYESLILGERFQVKRIVVTPGQRLSLQKHYHRAEHWVVVRGTATVRINDDERLLKEDESTYIPIGAVHRLENKGKLPLEIIEVQTGAYLGEDDIVRLEDIYGR